MHKGLEESGTMRVVCETQHSRLLCCQHLHRCNGFSQLFHPWSHTHTRTITDTYAHAHTTNVNEFQKYPAPFLICTCTPKFVQESQKYIVCVQQFKGSYHNEFWNLKTSTDAISNSGPDVPRVRSHSRPFLIVRDGVFLKFVCAHMCELKCIYADEHQLTV